MVNPIDDLLARAFPIVPGGRTGRTVLHQDPSTGRYSNPVGATGVSGSRTGSDRRTDAAADYLNRGGTAQGFVDSWGTKSTPRGNWIRGW